MKNKKNAELLAELDELIIRYGSLSEAAYELSYRTGLTKAILVSQKRIEKLYNEQDLNLTTPK